MGVAIDSAFLDNGLKAIADKIREKGGTTESLSFPDGFVSALDTLSVKTLKKYSINPDSIQKSSGNNFAMADWMGQTFYSSVTGTLSELVGSGGYAASVPADIDYLKGKYLIKDTELWYTTEATFSGYKVTYTVYDVTKLASATKTPVEDYSGDYEEGTYEFVGGNIYYYGE